MTKICIYITKYKQFNNETENGRQNRTITNF